MICSWAKSRSYAADETRLPQKVKCEMLHVTCWFTCIRTVLKVNHLVYIVPRWYGSQIYADCQWKLFSSEHDIGGSNLQVTFLAEQKRERESTTRRDNHLWNRACISLLLFTIRVPKVLFHFFDKLKYEIRNKDLIFVSILKLRYKTSN